MSLLFTELQVSLIEKKVLYFLWGTTAVIQENVVNEIFTSPRVVPASLIEKYSRFLKTLMFMLKGVR